jgi:DNA-binding transcriptional regulator YiaG
MQMISDSPLSRMKQCLSQIDQKYQALQSTYWSLEKKKLSILKLINKTDAHSKLLVSEYNSYIESNTVLMNLTLREIGMFQDMYDSIKKSNNIPDNWTEKDFEKQEIDHMIRSSFRLGIQDLSSTGRTSNAVVEYWEQLGIHPQLAETLIKGYLTSIQMRINKQEYVTINEMYAFLDQMVLEFKYSYKDALKRIGLNDIGSEEFMAKGNTKPQ